MVEHSEVQVRIDYSHCRPHSAVFPRLKQIVVNKAFRGFEEMQSRAEWQNLTLEAWLKRREKGDVEVAFVDTKEELGEQSRRW
jgi:hypothetical protein